MKNLNCVIIDDDPRCQKSLLRKIEDYCPDVVVSAVCNSTRQAASTILNLKPDIVFLDIEMPKKNGLCLFDYVKTRTFHTIIVTAHDCYGVEAMKSDAIDYLHKPVDPSKLQNAVASAAESIALSYEIQRSKAGIERLHRAMLLSDRRRDRIPLFIGDRYELVLIDHITRIEGNGAYTNVHFTSGKAVLTTKRLISFEAELKNCGFLRIHRSLLINLLQIRSFTRNSHIELELIDGRQYRVARRQEQQVNSQLFRFDME